MINSERKNNHGITLIALIVTIIVLLILVGVTIKFANGGEGILSKAEETEEVYDDAKALEEVEMFATEKEMEYYKKRYVDNDASVVGMTVSDYIKSQANGAVLNNGAVLSVDENGNLEYVDKNGRTKSFSIDENGKITQIENETTEEIIPAGSKVVMNGTGYKSISEALNAAQNSSYTIKVIADYEEDSGIYVTSNENITIDLNGKTVKVGILNNEGTLTIKDSVGSGVLQSTQLQRNDEYDKVWCINSGNMQILSGTIDLTNSEEYDWIIHINNGATLTVGSKDLAYNENIPELKIISSLSIQNESGEFKFYNGTIWGIVSNEDRVTVRENYELITNHNGINLVQKLKLNSSTGESGGAGESGTTEPEVPETSINFSYAKASHTGNTVMTVKTGTNLSDYEIELNAPDADDARVTFALSGLEANEFYEVSVDSKAESLGGATTYYGVGIGEYNSWASSTPLKTTTNWTNLKVVIRADSNGKLNFNTRIGFWSNLVSGKASFKNIDVRHITDSDSSLKIIRSDDGVVRIVLRRDDYNASGITDANAVAWANNLSKSRASYEELVGSTRYNGKLDIVSTNYYYPAWAFAEDPIEWMQGYQTSSLNSIQNTGEWLFGILHEIGHTYDADCWNFDAEMWANTKMAYILEKLDGMVVVTYGGHTYQAHGDEIKGLYEYHYNNSGGCSKNDGITYKLLLFKEKVTEETGVDGWEAFKKTFRYFASLSRSEIPSTKMGKFELFMQKLTEYSGVDTNEVFTATDLAKIQTRYSE